MNEIQWKAIIIITDFESHCMTKSLGEVTFSSNSPPSHRNRFLHDYKNFCFCFFHSFYIFHIEIISGDTHILIMPLVFYLTRKK